MFRAFALASSIPKTCLRRFSVSQAKHVRSDFADLKKKQIQFQLNEEIPIYIKRGGIDYVLYFTTFGLIVVGIGTSISSLYKLANKN